MLRKSQVYPLIGLGVVLWFLVMLDIRLRPQVMLDPVRGLLLFLAAPLAGWASIWLCKLVGRLSAEQLLSGVAVVGAVAMTMDGAALKWFSGVYGYNERLLHLAAAWLLWGYGVALVIAVVWAAKLRA